MRLKALSVLLCTTALIAATTQAADVHFGIGIGVTPSEVVAPSPVMVAPAPVVVAPPNAYVVSPSVYDNPDIVFDVGRLGGRDRRDHRPHDDRWHDRHR